MRVDRQTDTLIAITTLGTPFEGGGEVLNRVNSRNGRRHDDSTLISSFPSLLLLTAHSREADLQQQQQPIYLLLSLTFGFGRRITVRESLVIYKERLSTKRL